MADTVRHLEYVAGKEGITYEPEALHVIAEKADGGMRDALSIFDQVTSYCEGNITYQKVIEDLNVLDYDEYFGMTDTLLAGDIPKAMARLNHILSKGFEANYFIGGLASHFRNLLMSRDEQTLPLLDVSDQVRQRYHEQAKRCEPKLLYRALKLCNDCDMHYNGARNKRLLVELTLIEVAQAATGDDDVSCGRRPTRRLKPIFQNLAATSSVSAAQRTTVAANNATQPTAAAAVASTQMAAAHASVTHATAQPTGEAAGGMSQGTLSALNAAASRSTQHRARPVQTLSLRQMQADIQAKNTTKQQPTTTPTVATTVGAAQHSQKLRNQFNEDRLTYYWYRYAQQLPNDKRALMGRMKSMTLKLNVETWEVTALMENELVEQYMRQEQISLMNYLRTQLRNDFITLKFEIVSDDAPKRAFSRVEKFKDMLQRWPDLDMLRKELDLELA